MGSRARKRGTAPPANTRRRKQQHFHPAHRTRNDKRRAFFQPDAIEQEVQRVERLMREELSNAPYGDGLISGPLTVAARYAAPHLAANVFAHEQAETRPTRATAVIGYIDRMEEFDEHDEHVVAVEKWLVGSLGEVISGFTSDAYFAWRARGLAAASQH